MKSLLHAAQLNGVCEPTSTRLVAFLPTILPVLLTTACAEPAVSPQGMLSGRDRVELASNETHLYDLGALTPGDGHYFVLEQQGVDLVAEVVGPDGDVILEADSPTAEHGFEHVCFVASAAGRYSLRVRALGTNTLDESVRNGTYSIDLRSDLGTSGRTERCERALRTFLRAWRSVKPSEEIHAEAIQLWRTLDEPFPLAIALKQAGLFAKTQGRLDVALVRYSEAVALLRQLGRKGDQRQIAAVLNLAGEAHNLSGKPELSRASFEEALVVSQDSKDLVGEATAISNLGWWEAQVGDLHRALERHRRALALWRRLDRPQEEATALNVLGGTLTQLGLYTQAIDVLSKALEIRTRLRGSEGLTSTWMAIAWVKHLQGEGEVAVEYLQRALALCRETNSSLGEAAVLDRLGSVYRALDREAEAHQAYRAALALYRKTTDRLHTAHTASNLGCLIGAQSLLAEAASTLGAFGDRAGLAHVRFCQARVEREAQRLGNALELIEESVSIVDALRDSALRTGHYSPDLKLWQTYSELQVDLLMALHREEPGAGYAVRAFELSDLERARRLYERLLEARVDLRQSVPAELLEHERIIQQRINAVERRRLLLPEDSKNGNTVYHDQLQSVERHLRTLLGELESTQASIRKASPQFAELRQPTPIRLSEIREALAPDTLLLSYVLAEDRSFLFVVRSSNGNLTGEAEPDRGLTTYELPPRRELNVLAWRVWSGLRASNQRRTRSQLLAMAQHLGDVLLGPVKDELANHRLLVVGSGLLHNIPIAALPRPQTCVLETHEELVVDRHTVAHLPSAAVLRLLRERSVTRSSPPKTLAVLANAVYAHDDPRLPPGLLPTSTTNQWPPLPATAREARAILALVPPEQSLAAIGFTARPELVRSGKLQQYRILHFAVHGLLNDSHPELSGIALSMFDKRGSARDGFLRLHEIFALDLPVDLVVLSACRSASKQLTEGAGLVGMTHGFFHAGTSSLVVSLWDVDDDATAALMEKFYHALLADGLSAAASLREAQLWVKSQDKWKAEFYWAGFVLEGDWE